MQEQSNLITKLVEFKIKNYSRQWYERVRVRFVIVTFICSVALGVMLPGLLVTSGPNSVHIYLRLDSVIIGPIFTPQTRLHVISLIRFPHSPTRLTRLQPPERAFWASDWPVSRGPSIFVHPYSYQLEFHLLVIQNSIWFIKISGIFVLLHVLHSYLIANEICIQNINCKILTFPFWF